MSVNIKTENGLVKVAGKVNSFPVNKISDSDYLEDSPVGTVISFMGTTAPSHYLVCDGTVYNIADYSDLADFFQSQFGSKNYFGGDGTTTFAVPDLRGEFLRGTGTNSHTNQGSGANVGVHQNATRNIIFEQYTDNKLYVVGKGVQSRYGDADSTYSVDAVTGRSIYASSNTDAITGYNQYYTSRPTNTSVLYCIKYESTYFMEVEDVGYSTSETFTGKTWIDGKPIYRKVCIGTTSSTAGSWDVVPIGASVDTVISTDGKLNASNVWIPLNNYRGDSAEGWVCITTTNNAHSTPNRINIKTGTSYVNVPFHVIIEYTKTTD